MNKKKKLNALWLTPWYPHAASPQEGDFVQRMAQALSAQCNVTIVAFHESASKGWKISRENAGIETWHCYFPKFAWAPLRFLALTLAGLRSMWMLRKRQFDVVHGHTAYPAGHVAVLYSIFFKKPLLFSEHWSGFFKPEKLGYWNKRYLRLVLSSAKMIMPVSDSLKEKMKSLGIKGQFAIVPNVVDVTLFRPQAGLRGTERNFRFLYVGSLNIQVKSVDKILLAFAELCKACPDVALTLVGEGPDRPALEGLIEQLDLNGKCTLTGAVAHARVAELMATHHALVLFSEVETFSCVIAEALSSDLPVVTFDCGGLAAQMQPEDGIVVKEHDVHSLKNAMQEMKDKYEFYLPGQRSALADSFRPGVVALELIKHYQHCLKK